MAEVIQQQDLMDKLTILSDAAKYVAIPIALEIDK